MKKLILIVLLIGSFFVFCRPAAHAQMYSLSNFQVSYNFNPNPYGDIWQSQFLNPWSFQWIGNYQAENWPNFSFYHQPLSYIPSFEPDTLTLVQGKTLARSNQSSYFYVFPQPVTIGGEPPIISEEVRLSNILNPESSLYYLNATSPYYGFQLPDRGTPPFPREPRPR